MKRLQLPFIYENEFCIKHWDHQKNSNFNYLYYSIGSDEKAWWICEKGHSWQARISSLGRHRVGCPYCSGRLPIKGINDLFQKYPQVMKEWDFTKNVIDPYRLTDGSNKKVWWLCSKCGFSFQSILNHRVKRGSGCPICVIEKSKQKLNQFLILKNGSLKQYNPPVLSEWDYKKNSSTPDNYVPFSEKRVWWLCPLGHSFQQNIYLRVKKGVGCPVCKNENKSSFAEQTIFFYLKRSFPDAINRYIIKTEKIEYDIFIPSLRVAIEYDGHYFHSKSTITEKENQKNKYAKDNNILLIRIREQKLNNIVLEYIENENIYFTKPKKGYSNLSEVVSWVLDRIERVIGHKIGININLERDIHLIQKQYIFARKKDSILFKKPVLLKEWDFEKNENVNPDFVRFGSEKKFWWKCEKGHSWEARVSHRVKGSGCPYCIGSLASKENNLLILQPQLVEEWNYELNGEVLPQNIRTQSHKKVWWKCKNCQNSWQAPPYSRINGIGCPFCSHNKVTKDTSFATKYPEIALEWNYDRNRDLKPDNFLSMSHKKVWWKCKLGHEWEANISSRSLGYNCPYCAGQKPIKGKNDLITLFPEIIKEWDYSRNMIQPYDLMKSSRLKVWWKCFNGHSWFSSPSQRIKSGEIRKCPTCRNK